MSKAMLEFYLSRFPQDKKDQVADSPKEEFSDIMMLRLNDIKEEGDFNTGIVKKYLYKTRIYKQILVNYFGFYKESDG